MHVSDFRILECEPSPIGMICLRQRELLSAPGTFITEITLDHQFLMSSHNAASERALAERALALHGGSALQVLVGGLGLGCTAREVLVSDRVARLEVVELLPQVIGWMKKGLVPLGAELYADPRFSVRQGDVYAWLLGEPERTWDLLLIDVDHSPEERLADENGSFYTGEGLARVKRHLAKDGILGVWSYAESPRFAHALRSVFGDVRASALTFENSVLGEEETNWLYFARE